MKKAAWMVAATTILLAGRLAWADANSDLWTALKAANDKDALAAIAKGVDVNKTDPIFGTPLNYASCFAGGDVVKALIDAKSNVNFVSPVNGYTPLTNAANWGNTDAVKLLLAAGATAKVKTKMGLPALAVALNGCKLEILKLLVAGGADPKETYRMGTLPYDLNLLNALVGVYSPAEKVKNLKDNYPTIKKAGITYPDRLLNAKESDFTPLADLTSYLLEAGGFDPNQKVVGTWGCILNQAVDHQKVGIVQALLAAKAGVETNILVRGNTSGLNATPLMVAAAKGNNAIVELLIKAGAKVNTLRFQQKMEQSTMGSITTTTTITESNTAVSLANDNGHPDTVALLRKYGGLGPKELH